MKRPRESFIIRTGSSTFGEKVSFFGVHKMTLSLDEQPDLAVGRIRQLYLPRSFFRRHTNHTKDYESFVPPKVKGVT